MIKVCSDGCAGFFGVKKAYKGKMCAGEKQLSAAPHFS